MELERDTMSLNFPSLNYSWNIKDNILLSKNMCAIKSFVIDLFLIYLEERVRARARACVLMTVKKKELLTPLHIK